MTDWQAAAHLRADEARAHFERGWGHMRGDGGEKDPEQALYWMRRAAELGHPEALYRFGAWLALFGRAEEAIAWLERAAQQGHALAQLSLGHAYRQGLGVPESRCEAVAWYGRAAAQGLDLAHQALVAWGPELEKPPRRVDEGAQGA